MTTFRTIALPPIAYAELPAEWIEDRRTVVVRDGYALREGPSFSIEIKSLTSNRWLTQPLPGKAVGFVSAEELRRALAALRKSENVVDVGRAGNGASPAAQPPARL